MKLYVFLLILLNILPFDRGIVSAASNDELSIRCRINGVLDAITDGSRRRFQSRQNNIREHFKSRAEEIQLLSLFGGVSNKLLVHVIQVKGGYRVFHVKDDAFQAKFFKTPREAKQFLKTIKKPFELGSLSPKLIKEDSYIKKRLTGILGEGNFTQRIKDTYSGKRKIFDLIDNMGGRYPVSRLKDTLGYRIVTDTKKEVLRKVRLIKKDLKAKNEFVTVKQVDKKKKKQTGYRAKHIIAKTPEGQLYEIQVMTAVMKKWHAWDHKMVYKSDYPKGEYLDKLIKYSRAVAGYARNLEDGVKSSMPDYKEFGILEKDAFPDGI